MVLWYSVIVSMVTKGMVSQLTSLTQSFSKTTVSPVTMVPVFWSLVKERYSEPTIKKSKNLENLQKSTIIKKQMNIVVLTWSNASKNADGMANTVDPDQTAPSGL